MKKRFFYSLTEKKINRNLRGNVEYRCKNAKMLGISVKYFFKLERAETLEISALRTGARIRVIKVGRRRAST